MRLFVAVELPEGLKEVLVELQAAARPWAQGARARWVPKEQMHLTLAFLAEVEEGRLADLGRVLGETASRQEAFEARTSSPGAFPDVRRPRVLFLGLAPSVPLDALAADLREALVRAGFAPDAKPFHPHLTLARLVPEASLFRGAGMRLPLSPPPLAIPVRALALFQSHLGRKNWHERLADWEMKA